MISKQHAERLAAALCYERLTHFPVQPDPGELAAADRQLVMEEIETLIAAINTRANMKISRIKPPDP